ncbi:4-hydroxy-3-methylbut-2-en-1-yl diphosphate synthase [Carboxydocella sporoproducens DSM 16521]|uniref:4-hydroxy-3-methylbut-2-en-1-yl diphosphate synthase (flavodoxin) n=2 Tax=Carboxydocella TaxID=178898 RepID=A0A1T4P7I6_9FIRM|nr:4-hydroxy-3-methylbut-2-en-1-yl diphosphate synthase [Carboxydocella thermautotrophica]AVX31148.1 4-hydroxy-3-methylbut-2-en-1-yl diphosphate synthase [Carboxydocella thermautotrophica]GAW28258.1 4-hydroxy-3-methylbut-2-en-1-yl diphosphate synthase [Carboxydocella sp. ULO1]SJZ87454.1 4-hydroxy-3-methylbut-2-en-1-yl diphosphate synthase [Carboxydocella sporoproducens DSM 16521]
MASKKQIKIGNILIGGGAPVSVQSMTNTDTRDVETTLQQIEVLAREKCEIIRVAVPDEEAAQALKEICRRSPLPVIADIHFDYRLALKALAHGVAGLRINPGNIGSEDRVKEVVAAARERAVPIRIGVNAGSLEKDLLEKYGHPCAEALVESALRHVALLERFGYEEIKISLKTSRVPVLLAAYRLLAQKVPYPLHIGVTEAGTLFRGVIKSSVGLGILLSEGIGDTMRVSLTADPVYEVRTAWQILQSLNLRQAGPELVSCPTCGRCQVNLIKLAEEVDQILYQIDRPLKVAVMGCAVNGPGEAREADIGIAGGKGAGLLFKKGQVIRKVPEEQLLSALLEEIRRLD